MQPGGEWESSSLYSFCHTFRTFSKSVMESNFLGKPDLPWTFEQPVLYRHCFQDYCNWRQSIEFQVGNNTLLTEVPFSPGYVLRLCRIQKFDRFRFWPGFRGYSSFLNFFKREALSHRDYHSGEGHSATVTEYIDFFCRQRPHNPDKLIDNWQKKRLHGVFSRKSP